MLAVSPLRSNNDGSNRGGGGGTGVEASFSISTDEFPDFSGGNLLDSIDFDDLFMGMHDSDMLPDLEMDPDDLLAEFSISGGEDSSEANYSSNMSVENVVSPNSITYDGNLGLESCNNNINNINDDDDDNNNNNNNKKADLLSQRALEEIESKKKDPETESGTSVNSSLVENQKGSKKHKSSSATRTGGSNSNNSGQGKRKTKVDWTPELHRRFVQAVEQLGVDKAVPSRILELMGIDCLTRHNIASHLQKYRSHRKHLLAREAEAASWTQKRQMYGVAMGGTKGGGANISPWHPPTVGFPPMTPMHHHVRPLHVWGHPTMDPQARVPMWPKQVMPSPPPLPPSWPPHPPLVDPSFWHSSHHRRLAVPAVAGVPPHPMYRPEHGNPTPAPPKHGSHTPWDLHPSKESVDAVLGDVLAKPWLPLPIGLKPPSMDSVFVELQRQGVSKIPPSCA